MVLALLWYVLRAIVWDTRQFVASVLLDSVVHALEIVLPLHRVYLAVVLHVLVQLISHHLLLQQLVFENFIEAFLEMLEIAVFVFAFTKQYVIVALPIRE